MSNIRARAPLRLGLGGGGTDVSPYSEDFGGRILNATIDRYAYAFVEPREPGTGLVFHSPDRERTGYADPGDVETLFDEFPLHVAVYRRIMREFRDGADLPLLLATQVDAPPGSGLGSSSTLVVVMITAMCRVLEVSLDRYDMARLAWEIERVDLGMCGGWQDQYAATFGGFNYMESHPGGRVLVNPLGIRRDVEAELEASLLLYFGGVSRSSAEVIVEQQRNVVDGQPEAIEATHAIRAEAQAMKDHLLTGDIGGFAQSLRDGWKAKKKLASRISTPDIERAHDVAMANGMVAGKVSGAGGGGFMMLIVDPTRRLDVTRALESQCGGTVTGCHFTHHGAEAWRVPPRASR